MSIGEREQWLVGGGEMGELIRSMDWSATPLGALSTWPHSLRTTVNLCLSSNFPINIVWGPSFNQIYNDGYRAIVGERHPDGMGMPYNECWASAWPAIGGPFERAWKGETSFLENQRMYLTRNGYHEETFFTFSLSPIRNEFGVISGLFHPVTETTIAMLAERRTRALRELAANTGEARTRNEAFASIVKTLAHYDLDLPFAMLYALSESYEEVSLVDAVGIEKGLKVSPDVCRLGRDDIKGWPFDEIVRSGQTVVIEDVQSRLGAFACGPYPEGVHRAVACALSIPGLERPVGVFLAGISPRLPFDKTYRDYLDQVCAATSSALANALAYEQERKRSEALAEIDRVKTSFFANVSHEFRTPLALILGPLEAVLGTSGDELSFGNREQLSIVRRNSLRLLKLVNNLLDFSRIEAGRAEATFEALDLAALTAETSGNFRSAIESAGMELAVDCPPLAELVFADRNMWEKIVLNLLSNAFKFTMKGRIEVRLETIRGNVQLSVSDTGTGIPEEQLSHVFERFHRVENVQGRTHEGSGIGLALVDEFVRLHQGTVAVESTLGAGSTFTVTIPFGTSRGAGEHPKAAAKSATPSWHQAYTEEASRWTGRVASETTPPVPQRKAGSGFRLPPTIILAEDNADMRDYIVGVMGSSYHFRLAQDGQEALDLAMEQPPDLILSDVMMPRLDGFALVQALRSHPRTKTIPILLLSARAGDDARAEGMEIGADDYLVKPFSPRELKARVAAHIELKRLRSESVAHVEFQRAAAVLRESEKLAVVGRLAASIAHEINNPLEAVINLLYIIEGSLHGTEAHDYVLQAQQELARVSHITTQTLRFHRQSTNACETKISEVLEGVLTLFAARIVDAGVTITREYLSERMILAFAADLRQAFANFIGNALDASKPGGRIILRIREAEHVKTGESGLRVTVADTGHGMSKLVQQRIFEPFFTTKDFTGTGLGLWISSEILAKHEAQLTLRSSDEPDHQGTVFSIFFPEKIRPSRLSVERLQQES